MELDCFLRAPLGQLTRWWNGNEPPPPGWEDGYLDEVAHALVRLIPAGVQEVKKGLRASDIRHRRAALSALARPESADVEVRAALRDAFDAADADLKTDALWGFMHLGWFPLERRQLERLLHGADLRLAALAMCYSSRAFPSEAVPTLARALRSDNPRMREYACDEVGGRGIEELSGELRRLLGDSDDAVAQAARSNLAFFE
jgi:hypothetical protein